MTESGDPLENSLAERMNGILEEYLECYEVKDLSEAKALLRKSVTLYNRERPHMSISNMKLAELHENNQETKRIWKNYYAQTTNL